MSAELTCLAVVEILIIVSFFFFLSVAQRLSSIVIRAGIIGPLVVGIVYGVPIANILHRDWQVRAKYMGIQRRFVDCN